VCDLIRFHFCLAENGYCCTSCGAALHPLFRGFASQPAKRSDMSSSWKNLKCVTNQQTKLTRLPPDGSGNSTQLWSLAYGEKTGATHAKSCERCTLVLGGIQAPHVQHSRLSIDLRSSVAPILNFSGNESLVCGWIENLFRMSEEQLFADYGKEV